MLQATARLNQHLGGGRAVTLQRRSSSAANETGTAECQAFGLYDGGIRACTTDTNGRAVVWSGGGANIGPKTVTKRRAGEHWDDERETLPASERSG